VQGVYQHLSDELKVGWHPEYLRMVRDRLAEAEPAPLGEE
jgi:hypothetical protein